MPRYNDRRNGNNQTQSVDSVVTPVQKSFRADLADLVVDSSVITNKTNAHIAALEAVNNKFDEFLIENLVNKFHMEESDARNLGTMNDRIKYIEKNSWKLKVPEWAPIMDTATEMQNEIKQTEEDIREEIDKIIQNQDAMVQKNDELLKIYHQQLMEDTKRAEDLEIENAGLLNAIPDITASPLYREVENLKSTIDKKYQDIDDIRSKIEQKENDNITLNTEIDDLDDKIRNETAEIAALNREKLEIDRELMNLNKELSALKKTGTEAQIKDLEARIKEKNERRTDINSEINSRNNKVNSYRDEKSKKVARRNENFKAINTLNNEKRDLRSSVELNERDHRKKLEDLTAEREEDSEEVRRYKKNLKEIALLDIAGRKDEYKDKKVANANFKNEIDQNRQNIKDKFKEYKIPTPRNTSPDRKASEQIVSNDSQAQQTAAQTTAAPAKGGASGGAASTAAANTGLVPMDDYSNLSDRDLANNFYNDIVNKHYSPLEMQLRLSGYGFSTFVNVCEHLSASQRKKILPILKERRIRLSSTPEDELVFQDILGDDIYKLVYDSSERTPRNLSELSEEEIRTLSIAAEEFSKNIAKFDDKDIKVIESKFFDVLANSAVVDLYESSTTLKGRITGWLDNFLNRQRVQVVKELRGSMCSYHKEKVDRFATVDSRERKFKGILQRDTVRDPVASQRNSNVPDLTKGHSALRQDLMDRQK